MTMIERWKGENDGDLGGFEGIDQDVVREFMTEAQSRGEDYNERLNKLLRSDIEKRIGVEQVQTNLTGWRLTHLVNRGGEEFKKVKHDLKLLSNEKIITEEAMEITLDYMFREHLLLKDDESGNFDLSDEEREQIYNKTMKIRDETDWHVIYFGKEDDLSL